MSTTPRTDAWAQRVCLNWDGRGDCSREVVFADTARQLETELAAVTAELAEEKEAYEQMEMMANKLHGEIVAVTAERDALKSARDRSQEDWTETTQLYRALKIERDALLRGEYICKKCGIRKNGEGQKGDF